MPTLIMAWDLTATKTALSEVERILSLAHCFCRKFQGMLLNTPITCFLLDRAHLLVVHDRDCALGFRCASLTWPAITCILTCKNVLCGLRLCHVSARPTA